MIRSLRRRFLFSAMAAFGILLLILVLGVTVVSSLQLESRTDLFIESVLEEAAPGEPQPKGGSPAPRLHPLKNAAAYYDVRISAGGEIMDVQEKGVWEPDLDAARDYAARVIASGETEGKIDGYKFLLRGSGDGSARLILMDNSQQVRMLVDLLRTTLFLSLACLLLLFLILLPISSRVVRSYALHIEKQKQFITNAGHEIKTPVAIILSNVDAMELLQGENKWSRNIRSQTDRLNLLLQRLLFMARIDEKSLALPTEVLDLRAMLEAELETYDPACAERNLRLRCELCADVCIRGNRDYLQQLIHMLMDNAVQYADAGGEIHIALEKKRHRARICFANSVEKLPDCPPEALFDRFYRGDSARTQSSGGCGVGLSAARAIAEMHRGAIHAEYTGERALRFIVELPQ